MPHRYKVREIAQQSGLSEATVDRVLNERPGVRANTRAEVVQAIADLDKQRAQLRLNGRRYLIDVVMQTPERFSDAFRAAIEAELPAFAPAMLRARFHLWESGSTAQMVEALSRIRGSHGVVLKAQDEPAVAEAVDRLVESGVPVVTYATDMPAQRALRLRGHRQPRRRRDRRLPDAGVAGVGAVGRAHHAEPHGVPRRGRARGRVPLGDARHRPTRSWKSATATASTRPTSGWCSRRSSSIPDVEAVYSVGGGNTATVAAFERLGRPCRVFIAHDLDADNRRLLRDGRISVVLHNDLRADARLAMRLILQQQGALPVEPARPVPIQVITPYNLPP